MRIFFEGYKYNREDVEDINDHYIRGKGENVYIPYVGYYYSTELDDVVFILPKVFLNQQEDKSLLAFGKFNPREIIDTTKEDNPLMKSGYYDELFNLSTWIYRAIDTYKRRKPDENISEKVDIQDVQSTKGDSSATWIDTILSLIKFNNEHQHLFSFIASSNTNKNKRIDWRKTIARKVPILSKGKPIYMETINKSKKINEDEELFVLFYSVLDYLHEKNNFKIKRNIIYKTDTKWVEGLLSAKKGTKYLRSIRNNYFNDEVVKLWRLLYVFFDKANKIRSGKTHEEWLMVSNFNFVFEDMIDYLIGDDTKLKRKDLWDQPDGKIVDHIYKYESLLSKDDIYYIGDSKYYSESTELQKYSEFKQFTYAKNVIQLNMDYLGSNEVGRANYFDELTEGYNITPNFFIRGIVDPKDINYSNMELKAIMEKNGNRSDIKVERMKHHENRLFDRDTLFVQHYNINFLFVLAAYAQNRNNSANKNEVYTKFKSNIQNWLARNYNFYIMEVKNHGHLKANLNKHFRLLLGKVYAHDNNSIILGLENGSKEALKEIILATNRDFDIYEYDIESSTKLEKVDEGRIYKIREDKELQAFFDTYIGVLRREDFMMELIGQYSEKYVRMNYRDWEHLYDEAISKTKKHVRFELKTSEYLIKNEERFMAAEGIK